MSENKIKIKLEQIADTDKSGVESKDRDGNLLYSRNDSVALLQLLNAVDSKAVAVNEYRAWITIADKIKDAWKQDRVDVELNMDEAAFLKKILGAPQNDKITFSLFHVRTINSVLEQLK